MIRRPPRPPLFPSPTLFRPARDAAHRAHALDVEAVAAAELEFEAPKPVQCLLGAASHVVGIAEPDRPARRRAGATQPEQAPDRSEEHTSELQSQSNLVCRLL